MAGGRAYVDVVETNPPMAFLVYWPAVRAAQALGVAPELAAVVFASSVGVLSIALTLRIARTALGMTPLGLAIFGAALLVAYFGAPSKSFTQREHLALMLLMPAVTALAARSAGCAPGLAIALAAGLLAGLGASIKPHFTLVVAFPPSPSAIARRDARLLVAPEAIAAAAVFLAYAAYWAAAYPEFFGIPLFLVRNTYRLYVYRAEEYLQDTPAIVFLFSSAVALALLLVVRAQPAALTLGAALAAFAVAFVEQGKGFRLPPLSGGRDGVHPRGLRHRARGPGTRRRAAALRGFVFLAAATLGAVLSGSIRRVTRTPPTSGAPCCRRSRSRRSSS